MLPRRLEKIFIACFILFAALVLLQNGVVLAVLAVIGTAYLTRRPLPHFTIWIFVGIILFEGLIIWRLHPPLISDFDTIFQAARGLLAGDFSYQKTGYFKLWAYQTAFLLWETFWLRLWDSPLCIEAVHAVLAAGIVCLMYRLLRGWVSERAAQTASFFLAVSPFFIAFSTILSNQIPSAFFLTLGLWVLACGDCRKLGFWRFPIAGAVLQAGNLLRGEGVIVLTAVFAWAAFRVLRGEERVKSILFRSTCLLLVYLGIHVGASEAVKAAGLNPYGLQNGDPLWKFMTGSCYESQGGYSENDWDAIRLTLDENAQATAETDALQRALLRSHLSQKHSVLFQLFWEKVRAQWVEDGLRWALGTLEIEHCRIYKIVQQFERTLFFLALILMTWGLLDGERWRQRNTASFLPYFVFFAAFCAFLLVEVQPRYAYLPQLFVSAGAAFGIERLIGEEQHV